MTPTILIALRFLLAKKRAMLMSLGGIAFGVGFFIVTQAQTSGFQEFFIKTILGTDGAIRVEDKFQHTTITVQAGTEEAASSSFVVTDRDSRRYVEGVRHPQRVIEAVSGLSNIAASSSVLKGNVAIQSPLRKDSAQIYGIEIEDHMAVSDIEEQMVFGSIQSYRETPTGILLGKKLADRLQTRVGDSVILQAGARQGRFRVSGIYETGVSDIDRSRIFVSMSQARSLLQKPHGVSFIQFSVFDRDRAPQDALAIERIAEHAAAPWQEREKVWLDVFKALRISSAITVSTIIFVSGLGMFNTLAMIVMEKTREIAILRSMGYTRSDISSVFLWQGGIVLALGTLVGFGLGAGVTYGISSVPLRIRGIFTTDSFVVNWSLSHYLYAALTASVIVIFASLAPARRAARLVPGDVIRGTAL